MSPKITRIFLALAVAGGVCDCAGDRADAPTAPVSAREGGQTGGEAGLMCAPTVAVEALALTSQSPLGFSGQEVLAALGSEARALLSFADGTSPTLRVSVEASGGAGYAPTCSANEVDITLHLASSDGALIESLPAKLFARRPTQAWTTVSVPLSALNGSFATSHPELATLGSQLEFSVELSGGAASGSVSALRNETRTSVATF